MPAEYVPTVTYRHTGKGRRCPHMNLVGIYGDAINANGGYRLRCADCGRLLDGPVALADHDATIRAELRAEVAREIRAEQAKRAANYDRRGSAVHPNDYREFDAFTLAATIAEGTP